VSRRAVALWAGIVLVVSAGLLLLPRPETDDTLAFRRYLAHAGYDVREGGRPPETGTFILERDLRDAGEAGALLRWAEAGGRLVVADPTSAVLAMAGTAPEGLVGIVGGTTLRADCAAEEAAGVERIVARASDLTLSVTPAFVGCFAGRDGSYLVRARYGEGSVVFLGGVSALTNELLRSEDNAMLAIRLAGAGPDVVFGTPVPTVEGRSSGGLWSSMPDRAKVVVLGLCLAALVFALVRGRRLGRPVAETPIVPIPASELPRAVGRLYRRAKDPGYAGRRMREATTAKLARRATGDVDADALAASLTGTTGWSAERLHAALAGADPVTDQDLIRLGEELHELETRAGVARR
jgi:hypothetical protein